MHNSSNAATGSTFEHPPDSVRDFLLAAMRCARLRVQLLQLEIDEVGVALKFNLISPEHAVGWLEDIGAMPFIHGGLIATSTAVVASS